MYSVQIGRLAPGDKLARYIGVFPVIDGGAVDLQARLGDTLSELVSEAEAWVVRDVSARPIPRNIP